MKRIRKANGKTPPNAIIIFMTLALVFYFLYNTNNLNKDIRKASFEHKIGLVDAVLAGRVFETRVGELPVLSEVFREYEKAQKYFVEGLNMKDYDKSCNDLYEDSVSGDFDESFYEMKEYEYKVIHRNRTDVKVNVCQLNLDVAPF